MVARDGNDGEDGHHSPALRGKVLFLTHETSCEMVTQRGLFAGGRLPVFAQIMPEANNLTLILLAIILVIIVIGGVYWDSRKQK